MHCLQNTVLQTQYLNNKEDVPYILPHAGFEHRPLQRDLETLLGAIHLIEELCYHCIIIY